MLTKLKNKYFAENGFLKSAQNNRTQQLKKQIFFSFIIKGLNTFINLLIVPLSLNYLDIETYGVWLTISSIVLWFNFFDIGLGNGLRNRITENLAINNITRTQQYISTAYFALSIISFFIFLIFVIINEFLDWNNLLNVSENLEINSLIVLLFFLFSLRFVFQLINSVLRALQQPAIPDFILMLGNLFSLVTILLLQYTPERNIFKLGVALSLPPVILLGLSNLFFYWKKYDYLKPNLKGINKSLIKDLLNIGIKFFLIQIAALIIYSSSNIVINTFIGSHEVTVYNIAFKYFNLITMIISIIFSPFWSAFTDAYTKNDIVWIKKMLKKMVNIWYISIITIIIMIFVSDFSYKIWIGTKVSVPMNLTILMGIFVITNNWNFIFVSFINGVGKVKLQLYSSMFIILLNIPLAILFIKFGFKSEGVVISNIIFQLIGSIWAPIQVYKIINKKDNGIWSA